MNNPQITQTPISKTAMLIRRPATEVFEAFINPAITTKFWFTKSSGRNEVNIFRISEMPSTAEVLTQSRSVGRQSRRNGKTATA